MSVKVDKPSSVMCKEGEGENLKTGDNHMSPVMRLRNAPRCHAMSKRTKRQCQAPAERGKTVCRFHGARAGAPSGKANGQYRHGRYTKEALAERRELATLMREAKETLARI